MATTASTGFKLVGGALVLSAGCILFRKMQQQYQNITKHMNNAETADHQKLTATRACTVARNTEVFKSIDQSTPAKKPLASRFPITVEIPRALDLTISPHQVRIFPERLGVLSKIHPKSARTPRPICPEKSPGNLGNNPHAFHYSESIFLP